MVLNNLRSLLSKFTFGFFPLSLSLTRQVILRTPFLRLRNFSKILVRSRHTPSTSQWRFERRGDYFHASRISTFFAPINWSMYEICYFMRRFTSRSPIAGVTVSHRIAVKNLRKNAIFCTFSFATQRISLVSQFGERDEILGKKMHISYTDQFVVPPIFKYLVGAKNVEIRLTCIRYVTFVITQPNRWVMTNVT